jgi:hypothetical protein
MSQLLEDTTRVVLIGAGATALMDLWLLLLRRLGVQGTNFALVGRWAGHAMRGQWFHDPIAKSAPVAGERALGWLVHYAVGIAFAGVLLGVCGMRWAGDPSLPPALALGIASVAAPLFVMQPAMGAGVASSRTPTPAINCLRSLASHTVFGLGLYASALVLSSMPW